MCDGNRANDAGIDLTSYVSPAPVEPGGEPGNSDLEQRDASTDSPPGVNYETLPPQPNRPPLETDFQV
jgi:hypothetical protein